MSSDSLLTSARGGSVPAPRRTPQPGQSTSGATVAARADRGAGRAGAEPLLRRVLDGALDAAVVSFALWTLLYWVGLVTQWRLWVSGWLWLGATVALVVWRVVAAVRAGAAGRAPTPARTTAQTTAGTGARTGARTTGPDPVRPRSRSLLLLAGAAASAVAVVAAVLGWPATFAVTWVATVAAVAAFGVAASGVLDRRRGGSATPPHLAEEDPAGSPGRWSGTLADLGVLVLTASSAVLSLVVHLADTDDPYYLNRSVWVAEHGNAALRDTMFSPEVLNTPYGGGVPIASIEALLGVLAHLAGVRAGAMTWLVATPVGTVLAVWAMWRLARRWAPERAFLVLAVAVAFLMLSGDSMLGNFWVVRMWQGKVVAVTVLMPLAWAWLTEAAEAPDGDRTARRRLFLLLLAGGVAFAGLTPTAVVWAPVMCGAALVAATVVRSRALAVGGLLFLVGPLLSGLAVVAFSSDVGGERPVALPSQESFVRVLGETDPMVALALLGLCLAPVAARRGAPAALAGASALLAVLSFAPGVLPLLNAVTGSGPILWRMLFVAPVPVLVGLLATYAVAPVRLGRSPRTAGGAVGLPRVATRAGALAVGLVLLAGLVVGGRPVWRHTAHGGPVTVTSSPEWKVDVAALRDVRALDGRGLLDGVVLLPPIRMKVLTMYTTDAFAVVPRHWFVRNMREPLADRRARYLLYRVVAARPPFPPPSEVGAALRRLDVTLACAGPSPHLDDVVRRLEAAGYAGRTTVGALTCVTPPR